MEKLNKYYVGVIERNWGAKVTYSLKFKTWLSIGKTSEMCMFCNLFRLM